MSKSKSLPLVAVTGAERPYLYDLPNILSLPAGLEFRFRYRARWIGEDLRRQVDSGVQLAGRALHLYFHSVDTARLLPIRECEVVALERLGPVYFLRFRVRGFAIVPSPPSSGGTKPDVDDKCSETLLLRSECELCRASHLMVQAAAQALPQSVKLGEGLPEGAYLRESLKSYQAPEWTVEHAEPEVASRSWYHSAAIISHCEPKLRGVPLFYLLGFQDERDRWVKPKQPRRVLLKPPATFTLVSGQRYRFRLVEWRSDASVQDTMRLDCIYSPALLAQEGSSSLVVGKYDVPEFTFRAQNVGVGEVAAATHPIDPSVDTERWPTYYAARVPIRVRRNHLAVVLLTFLTLAGIALYALPEVKWIAGLDKGTWRVLFQFPGLIFMFFGSGTLVGRFVQMGAGIIRLPASLSGQDAGTKP